MDTIHIALIRFIQAFILVFFAFVLSGYFGTLMLMPLAGFYHLIGLLTDVFGFNGIFAAAVAIPTVVYLIYAAYQIPGFFSQILDTGLSIFHLAKAQFAKYEEMIRKIRGLPLQQNSVQAG